MKRNAELNYSFPFLVFLWNELHSVVRIDTNSNNKAWKLRLSIDYTNVGGKRGKEKLFFFF